MKVAEQDSTLANHLFTADLVVTLFSMTNFRFKVKSGSHGSTLIAMIGYETTPKFIGFLRSELRGQPFHAIFNQTDENGFQHDRFELSSEVHPGVDLESIPARFRPN